MSNKPTFLEFLNLEERYALPSQFSPNSRPYYETSEVLKAQLDRMPRNLRDFAVDSIREFKSLKTANPGYLIPAAGWRDHAMRVPSGDPLWETHLRGGKAMLIYYHAGRYLLLLDIIDHSAIDKSGSPKNKQLIERMQNLVSIMKPQVERKLQIWDEKQSGIKYGN